MRMTQLFTKTRKDAPADEQAKNAQLLIKAGYVHKEMAGVYNFLPLGLLTLNKIIEIIREEMNKIDGQEVFLSALQRKEVWEKSGRWDDEVVDDWFKTQLKNSADLGLGFTHEEPITELMRNYISSYKDLPKYPYQFQTKFRNELRAKSGIMRTREFIMKDLYSFSRDQQSHDKYYERVKEAYLKIFERMGLGDVTYLTFASGGSFSKYSHEFQVITDVGEDTVMIDESKKIAINKEVNTPETRKDIGLDDKNLVEQKAVEVGNIFTLGTKFSEPLSLKYTDEDGSIKPVVMGSYGIGPARVMGVIAEHFSDDKGLVWPTNIAPYQVYLATVGVDSEVTKEADNLYKILTSKGIEVLYDDREERPGKKFADADLTGIPYRLVVSPKTVKNNKHEFKSRTADKTEDFSAEQILKKLLN